MVHQLLSQNQAQTADLPETEAAATAISEAAKTSTPTTTKPVTKTTAAKPK